MRTTLCSLLYVLAMLAAGQVVAKENAENKNSYLEGEGVVEGYVTSQQRFRQHSLDSTKSRLVRGETHFGYINIGSWPTDVIFTVLGFDFDTPIPQVVIAQPRQSVNLDLDLPDQFNIQIIETGYDFIRMRVRRMDDGTGSSGWGQDLRVDFWIVE